MQYRSPRIPTDRQVRITHRDGAFLADSRNISTQGICVSGAPYMRSGERVQISLAGRPMDAIVIWSRNGIMGLRLGRTLSDAEIGFFRGVSHGAETHATGWIEAHARTRFREL